MSTSANDRRQIYDLDYFAKGGTERRTGPWRTHSISGRRSCQDRRKTMHILDYAGPERRSGMERRS